MLDTVNAVLQWANIGTSTSTSGSGGGGSYEVVSWSFGRVCMILIKLLKSHGRLMYACAPNLMSTVSFARLGVGVWLEVELVEGSRASS